MKEPNAIPQHCHLCSKPLRVKFKSVLDPQTSEIFEIHECEECTLGHTLPQPASLSPYYGPAYHGGRHGLTARYCAQRRVRIVNSLTKLPIKAQRLLDIGCGDGTFLTEARQKGWDVYGTEMNPAIALEAGLKVYNSVDDLSPTEPFDCITMWHSLEHIRDPLPLVKALEKLLSPTGFLVIAVPDAGGMQAKAFRSKWFHLDVPRHLYHFNNSSLSKLLNEAGLEAKRHWHQEFEYDLFGWSQSALNSLMRKPNIFFNTLTRKPTSAGRFTLTANFFLGAFLSVITLPCVLIGTLTGRGGTLITAAQRQPAPVSRASA